MRFDAQTRHYRESSPDATARRFWEHAAFTARGRDGVYLVMERTPQAQISGSRLAVCLLTCG